MFYANWSLHGVSTPYLLSRANGQRPFPLGLSVPKDRIEFFRPPPETFREERGKRMDGELTQDMIAAQAGGP